MALIYSGIKLISPRMYKQNRSVPTQLYDLLQLHYFKTAFVELTCAGSGGGSGDYDNVISPLRSASTCINLMLSVMLSVMGLAFSRF